MGGKIVILKVLKIEADGFLYNEFNSQKVIAGWNCIHSVVTDQSRGN